MLLFRAAALVVAAAVGIGCAATMGPAVVGSGVSATEDRDLSGFTQVHASTGIDVTVTVGTTDEVTVTADDNILPLVSTKVEGDKLQVSITGSVSSRNPIKVAVTAKKLTGVSASAGATITGTKITGDKWAVEVSSGGTVKATGTVGDQTVSVSSGGSYEAGELATRATTATASSGGSAVVRAAETLTGSASSGGSVSYRGSPKKVSVSESSGGSVGPAK